MTGTIKNQRLIDTLPGAGSRTAGGEVLPGEIEGLRTLFHVVAPGDTVVTDTAPTQGRVYLFTSGTGYVGDGGDSRSIDEIALLAPRHGTALSITATDAPLHFLELVVALDVDDLAELQESAAEYPLLISYSNCSTYRERIKSEKTVNRSLLPEHTFPRLCIGSVETTGDDRVGAHEHPMLEQLFYGLRHNDCLVRADDAELAFGEGVLLHIPLGSRHGVEVRAPRRLHYIWIDLFRDREGMAWITQEHVPDP